MRLGQYDHLNNSDPPKLVVPMPDLVALVRGMNYGEHRFLSELVKQRRTSPEYQEYEEYRKHTEALAKFLEESGYF